MSLPVCNLRRALRMAVAINKGTPFLRNNPRIRRALFSSLFAQYPEFLRAELDCRPIKEKDHQSAQKVHQMFADFDLYEAVEYLISRKAWLAENNSHGIFSEKIALYSYLIDFVVDFACVDFSGVDFSGADFSGVDGVDEVD